MHLTFSALSLRVDLCLDRICIICLDHENDRAGIEESTLLLTLSVFIVSCPVPVVHCPTVTEKCIDIFKESWESSQPQVCCSNN